MKVIIKGVEKYLEGLSEDDLSGLKKAKDVHIVHRGHAIDLEIKDAELASFVLEKKFGPIFK